MTTRTFRIFISSTFEDLVAERNAPQLKVFPRLRNLCEAHSARFEPVDLRWGVSDEAVLDQRLMDICFAEIERCQRAGTNPNFIILVGDRYGRPVLPGRILADEFEGILEHYSPGSEKRSLIEKWYQRDKNALSAEYLLKPRSGELTNRAWEKEEDQLRDALLNAASSLQPKRPTLLKYHGSATHQEIVKGLGPDFNSRQRAFAFFRNEHASNLGDARLEELKDFLREQLDGNIHTYEAGNLDELCTAVAGVLERAIVEELAGIGVSTELTRERKAQSAFARNRRRYFKGRKQVLKSILEHVQGSDARPLVLQGVSGCGKSAIMAQAAALVSASGRRAVSIRRFVGVTPASSNGLTLLQSICEEVASRYNQLAERPVDFSSAVNTFRDCLAHATAERPLRLFVDAVDRLDPHDPAGTLAWVPAALPPDCRIILSTNYQALPSLDAKVVQVDLFSPEDVDELLLAWFNRARRTLQPEQRDLLVAYMRRSGLPLYFKLAFEEALLWRSFDHLDKCVLAEGIEGIIGVLFKRLSAHHGPLLVTRSLGYLAASPFWLNAG